MAYQSIPLERFSETFATSTELSSVAIGGNIVSFSDEFFAEAFHLLLAEPAPSLKGQFGPKGALYSGWETRRHNPTYDWVVIKLGTTGTVKGFDIDTTHFNGNEAPEASVQAVNVPDGEAPPTADDSRWSEILPKVKLGPTSRHLFTVPETSPINYVKLNMYPDGGIARFRVYGDVVAIHPASSEKLFDAAHVFAGGRVVFTSDQHFGVGSNLILPGRGKDMGDGWETKRSRQPNHKDWVIIKLGAPVYLSDISVDTAHFKGNFPQYCEVHAIQSATDIPPHSPSHQPPASANPQSEANATASSQDEWTLVLSKAYLGPHREHSFQLENVVDQKFTHIRLTIYPDGGVKRIRAFGSKVPSDGRLGGALETAGEAVTSADSVSSVLDKPSRSIPALPITPEAFSPFSQVIQSYPDVNAVPSPRTTKVTPANFGTALKYHKLALLDSSYPEGSGATPGISVYHCQPVEVVRVGNAGQVEVNALERHPHTNQAFIPMGKDAGKRYVVVVGLNSPEDKPDLQSLRAFLVRGDQGIVYNKAVWHLPMTVLDGPMDLACVETQIGNGDASDYEIVELKGEESRIVVRISNA
ncbi:Allantoicase [Amylostereum chailletii]|nr:Allantoicase [Amylostereum chailletii]